jgi:hypothetical protein
VGSEWFDAASYGLIFGLVQMFASLGSAIGQPTISALLAVLTWQQLLAGFASAGVWANGAGASAVVMFAVGLFAGTHILGFTVAGESVPPNLIGGAAAVVNGVCFVVGGAMQAIPGYLLPDDPTLTDFRHALWIMPVVLMLGGFAALGLREPRPEV